MLGHYVSNACLPQLLGDAGKPRAVRYFRKLIIAAQHPFFACRAVGALERLHAIKNASRCGSPVGPSRSYLNAISLPGRVSRMTPLPMNEVEGTGSFHTVVRVILPFYRKLLAFCPSPVIRRVAVPSAVKPFAIKRAWMAETPEAERSTRFHALCGMPALVSASADLVFTINGPLPAFTKPTGT
jgi:hypothetical protein